MEVYFTDRKFNILGMASTSLPGAARLYNDKETDEIESGISTFEGDLVFDDNKEYGNIEEVTNMAKRGNYIMFLNRFNQSKFFTIIDTEKNRKDNTINFYAEDAGLDLLNETVGAYASDTAQTAAQYINRFTNDSGFVIGVNEISNLSRKLSWEGVSTATERIMSVANSFDGAEISFSFEIKNMKVSKKIINIYKQRGQDTKINLFLGKEIDNIITKESVANLATALFPEGGTPEGKDKPINLAGYKYNDGRYMVTNGGHLLDMEANKEWSRYNSPGDTGTDDGYIVKRYSYETTSQSELFNRSLSELKKISEPEINFVVDILDLPDNITVGDRVNIIDENDQLFLSARILKLEIEETMDKATATLGDYLIKYSDVDSQLIALAEEVKNIKPGDTYFPSVMYADDDSGNGFNASPRGKSYMAIIYRLNNPSPSEIRNDYNGKWIKIEGSVGAPGENGQTMYIWIKYADTIVGGGMSNDPNGKTYIGIAYNKETQTESDNPLDYQWSLYKGPKGDEGLMGLQGPSGDQGLPGKTGADGKTNYTHIAYANNSIGTVGFSTSDSAGKEFIGMYVDFIEADSTNPSLYNWTLIKGADGSNGTPGPKGTDGKTSYLHIAYSNSSDGTIGFSTTDSLDKSYIGQYTDFILADSNTPSLYSWSLVKGDKGDQGLQGLQGPSGSTGLPGAKGADGRTSYTHIAYSNSSNGVTNFSVSDSLNRAYIGMYVDFTEADSTNPALYNWSLIKGADGSQGTAGAKGADGLTPYLHIAYATNATGTTGFSTTDSVSKTYIGQYTDFVAADSVTPSKYAWTLIKGEKGDKGDIGSTGLQGLQGPSGATGLPGAKGADGRTSYTHIAYSNSSNGVTDFSVSDSFNRDYIGMYVDFIEADSSTPSVYNWSLIKGADGANGTAGPKGDNGQTPYLHIAYSTSITGSTGFSTTISEGKTHIGQYTDFVAADSTVASKYKWTLVKGDKGDQGLQGLQGPTGASGIKGATGADGKSSYTHIAYATNANGTVGFSVSDSLNKTYIGMYVDFIEADSTNPALYNWTLIKGADGSQGTAGVKGADGQTPYLHIAYATNSTGTAGFSINDPSGKTYIGQYTDFILADSSTPSKYLWTLIKGDTGATGPQGPKGSQGVQGLQGPTGASGIAGAKGADGKTSYTHIAYATNATGTTGFSVSDSVGKTYIGMYTDFIEADSTVASLYNWSLIKGADGSNGIQGPTGANGQTSYLHIAYATNATGSTGFSTTDSVGKTYIGQYTDFISADSSVATKYQWTLIKGDTGSKGATGPQGPQGAQGLQGLQGIKGADGIKGATGADGRTSYTHIAYATNSAGTSGFSVSDSLNKTYIGMYVDFTEADSTNPALYSWSLIKGADGSNGIQGPTGANGKTPYLHIAYANNSTGSSGFSTTISDGKTYIGQYTDFIAADSSVASMYQWTLIKGDKGATGATGPQGSAGISVSNVDVQYYLSTSATVLSGGSWVTTAPAWVNGRYMWTKTVTTYSNSTKTESSPVNITGAAGSNGATGSTGATGKSVSSMTEEYYLSTSKTAQSGGSWVTVAPAYINGRYMWTRIKIIYTNPASTAYTTAMVDSAWEELNGINTKINNAVTTIDTDGITVKDGSFYLQDDISDTKYSTVAKTNLIRDHGFELIDFNASVADGVGYNTITPNQDPIWLWQNIGSPKVYSAKGSNIGDSGMFGLVSAAVNSANYLMQCVPAMVKRQFTASAFFTKSAQGAAGIPAITIDLVNSAINTVKYTVTKSFAVPTVGNFSRYSLTINIPSNITVANDDFIRVRFLSANTNWVLVDGTQLVEGPTPVLYAPETLLFDMMNGVKGSAANSIQSKYIGSNTVRAGEMIASEYISEIIGNSSNLNNYQKTGFYKAPTSALAATIANTPSNDAFSLLVETHAGVKQTFSTYRNSNVETWQRNMYDNVWGRWERIDQPYEEGSNSNGDYIRFNNGIQIAWKLITYTNTSGFTTNYRFNWSIGGLPASFKVLNNVQVSARLYNGSGGFGSFGAFVGKIGSGSGSVWIQAGQSDARECVLEIIMIGRWK